jgi:hypothetical protein
MTQLNSKVNPPVELENDGIVLNQGLDLTTSNLQVDKGALRDCLNFEVVDRLGYQTLSGFDRYDGSLSPDQVEFYVFELDLDNSPIPPGAGDKFRSQATPANRYGVIVERLVQGPRQYIVYARFSADLTPSGGETLEVYNAGGLTAPFEPLSAPVPYTQFTDDENAADIYARFEGWNDVLRAQIDALPNQPIGVHWYRDRLYAVVDELRMGFTSGGGILVAGPPTEVALIEPNMILRDQANTFCCRVLDVVLQSGAWLLGNAVGMVLIEPVPFFDGVDTAFNQVPPTSGNFDALIEVPNSSNWNDPANDYFINLFTARALTASDPQPTFAGLWRTKDEPSPGWEYIESGWVVPYNNGFSFADTLRAVERATDNNFQFGSDDKQGLSALWFNGTDVSPENTEITPNEPGWRDVSGFAVDDTALETDDGVYLHGDIDFGVRVSDGLTTRIANAIVNNQPASVQQRLASVDPIALPASGTQAAGVSSARSPMMFLGLGPIFDQIPRDAQVSGIEISGQIKVAFGVNGLMPIATYATAADAETALISQVNNLFLCSAQFGSYNTDAGKFETKGQKRSATLPLPATRASYTWSTTTGVLDHTVEGLYALGSDTTLTIGGTADLFGLVDFDREDFDDQGFGLILYGENAANPTPGIKVTAVSADPFGLVGATRLSFDSLFIKIYYDEPSARYYVREAGSTSRVLTFDLVKNTVTSGQLRNSDAVGELQVVNVTNQKGNDPAWTEDKFTIKSGDEIFLDEALSRKVADVTGAMTLNGFAPLKDILSEGSRYQFITANFFAREDWDGFYGVSGAGKAFSFAAFDADNDGDEEQYVQFITTNTIVPDEDKPRHVAFHQYHLALGYRDGTVRFSVPGEPENFDGLAGAAEVGVGDRVTGLLGMRGKALGVFCDGSIYTILGDSAETFNVEVLSPYSGAIEYTVVDNGGQPLYCDYRGISTLEQSQRYGNFVGYRISQKVTPWLLPRMTRADNLFEVNNAAGVVCAVPVRSKNQYRIFFRDGFFLIYTAMPDGSGAFTYGQYYLNEDRDDYFVPICHSSQVDNDGKERIHMAHYSPKSGISASASKYVYEFENGLGFDGSWYEAFFDTAFSYKDPFKDNTIRKIRADGLTRGYGPYTITVAKDYDEDSYSSTLIPLSLPRNPGATPTTDYKPATTMANVAKEGRCLSFRVSRDEDQKTLVPPTVFQVLLVQYQSGGKRDA